MPAKKKTAAKKVSKKTAAKKATKKAASKKAPATKAAPKKAAAKKAPAKEAAAPAKASGKTTRKPTASELLKRTQHHTPAIFKVGTRKAAPVIFTLENVREILKKRAKEDAMEAKEAKKAAPAKPAAKGPAPAPVNDLPEPVKSKHVAASLADILGFMPSAGPTESIPENPVARTVPRKFKKFYNLLIELRSHVQESLGMHAEDTLKRSIKEDSGDISTSSDAGTDNFDRDFALSVVSNEQEALKEIEAAIARVFNGTYGTCEITGEAISPERLEAVPFTRFSLEGQRQHESSARRRVQRAGAFLSEGAADGVSFGDDDGDN